MGWEIITLIIVAVVGALAGLAQWRKIKALKGENTDLADVAKAVTTGLEAAKTEQETKIYVGKTLAVVAKTAEALGVKDKLDAYLGAQGLNQPAATTKEASSP